MRGVYRGGTVEGCRRANGISISPRSSATARRCGSARLRRSIPGWRTGWIGASKRPTRLPCARSTSSRPAGADLCSVYEHDSSAPATRAADGLVVPDRSRHHAGRLRRRDAPGRGARLPPRRRHRPGLGELHRSRARPRGGGGSRRLGADARHARRTDHLDRRNRAAHPRGRGPGRGLRQPCGRAGGLGGHLHHDGVAHRGDGAQHADRGGASRRRRRRRHRGRPQQEDHQRHGGRHSRHRQGARPQPGVGRRGGARVRLDHRR